VRRVALLTLLGFLVGVGVPTRAHAMSSDAGDSLLLLSIAVPGTLDAVLFWSDVYMAIADDPPSRGYYKFEVGATAPQIPLFLTIAVVASSRGSPAAPIAWGMLALPSILMAHGIHGLLGTAPDQPSSSLPDSGAPGSPAGGQPVLGDSGRPRAERTSLSWSPAVIMAGWQTAPGLALFGRF
jgi:hypothetical protein